MKRIKLFFQLSGKLMKEFLPLVLLQAVTFVALSIFFMLIKPMLLQSVFSALELRDVSETMEVCLGYALVLAAAFLLAYLNNVILDANCFRAIHRVICNIFMRWHEVRSEGGDEGTVFQNVTAGAQSLLMAPMAILQFAGTVGALLFLLMFSSTAFAELPVILGVLFAALVLLNRYELRMMQERENKEQEALGITEEKAHQLFHGMSFFEQHGVFAAEQKEYEGTRQKAWEAQLYKVNGHSTVELISEALIGASFTALFLSIISGAGERVVTMANMAVAISLLQSIAGNVAELLTNIKEMTGVLVPLERVSTLLEEKGQTEEADFRKAPVVIRTSSSEIVIKEGEHVAVIGHNGSGKTTLLSKIAGISYQENGVPAEVYGGNAEALSYGSRREVLSIAPKEELLFDASAEENILMNASDGDGRNIVQEAQKLGAEKFLSLNASELSGGQAKRINLLRACIHPVKIILADEPTASLDAENAKKAMRFLHESAAGKVLVVVTHDPESLPDFDKIIFMDHLEPVFAGSYEELTKSGVFESWRSDVQETVNA